MLHEPSRWPVLAPCHLFLFSKVKNSFKRKYKNSKTIAHSAEGCSDDQIQAMFRRLKKMMA